MKRDYLEVLRQKRAVLLGRDVTVQMYLRKVRGGAASVRIVTAAARGILLAIDKSKLEEFGGSVQLNRFWAHS